MDTIEKTISNLVEEHFPKVYQEQGPAFVLFVKKYYEWLETQDQVNFHTRNYFEYKDIDETAENFLVYFKETYLKNIQIDTIHDVKQLIKHSLDLYRSKGSERAIELLFRAVFGVDAEVYYPREDIFRLSDAKWVKPKYLEISLQENNGRFVGRQIKGMTSNAVAFAEKVIRRNIDGKLNDIMFISAVNGNFIPGEQINFSKKELSVSDRPLIYGSLNSITLDNQGSGQNYSIGDVVTIISNTGFNAQGKILATANVTGKANFSLVDGGFGFSNLSTIYVSEKVITLSNTSVNTSLFEYVSQNIAQLNYLNANGIFSSNSNVYAYYTNNDVSGVGKILSVSSTNTTAGQLYVEVVSGDLNANAIYSTGNTIGANLNVLSGYVNTAALGMVIAQKNSNNYVKVGLVNVNNQFFVGCNTFSLSTNASSNTIAVSLGESANVIMYDTFLHPEVLTLNLDLLITYANTQLNAAHYEFPAFFNANIATPLATALTYANVTFGTYYLIQSINPGNDYTDAPMVKIYDYRAANFNRYNQTIDIDLISGTFKEGEVITQDTTNCSALVITSSNTQIYTRSLRLNSNNQMAVGEHVTGIESGAIANVVNILNDINSLVAGNNSVVNSSLTISNGSATSIAVNISGFNFTDGELITFGEGNNSGTGLAVLGGIGSGEGYFKDKNGFLSSTKRLFDGYYYQDYSYDIISSLSLETYKTLLKEVIHMAGMNLFGTLSKKIKINSNKNTVTLVK